MLLTSPFRYERVDIHQCYQQRMRDVKSLLPTVQGNHQSPLDSLQGKASLASCQQGEVHLRVE